MVKFVYMDISPEIRKTALEHLRRNLGKRAEEFIAALSLPVGRAVRINTLKAEPKAVAEKLRLERKAPLSDTAYLLDEGSSIGGDHPYHRAGLLYLQEPSAMLPIEAAKPYLRAMIESSDYPLILDMCAAPGGKSGKVAELMGGKGLLVANEISAKRAAVLSGNLERLGVKNAMITSSAPKAVAEAFRGIFDAVIVDAPCSGEGMLRKEASAWENMTDKVMLSCAERQSEILSYAVKTLKPGGLLVYSTCTLNETENEGVLKSLISSKEFEPLKCEHLSGAFESDIFPAYRIFPCDGGGEGHFACVMRKLGGESIKPKFVSPFEGEYRNRKELLKVLSPLANAPIFFTPYSFRDSIILAPKLPKADGVYIVRVGVKAASVSGSTLVPDHCYAMSLTRENALLALNIPLEDEEKLKSYFQGEQLPYGGEKLGFGLIGVDGYPLGLVKVTRDGINNRLPKGMRK